MIEKGDRVSGNRRYSFGLLSLSHYGVPHRPLILIGTLTFDFPAQNIKLLPLIPRQVLPLIREDHSPLLKFRFDPHRRLVDLLFMNVALDAWMVVACLLLRVKKSLVSIYYLCLRLLMGVSSSLQELLGPRVFKQRLSQGLILDEEVGVRCLVAPYKRGV